MSTEGGCYTDFLSDGGGGGDDNASNDSQSTSSSVGSNNSSNRDKPMQLPRVGWGTDDDNEDENGSSNSVNNSTGVELPSINNNNQHQNKEKGVIIRSSTRNHTEGGDSLPPIPEERSMHGGIWSDYCYPDYYDYDRRKYRRCGPYFKRRLLAIILILGIGAFIGYRLGTGGAAADTPHKQLPEQQTDSDNNDEQKFDYPTKEQLPPGMDIYHVIIDTLDPQMFDASSDTQSSWDGSFFHAFEFCGKNYARVPCPYVAYCPLGPGQKPLGGTKNDYFGQSWAPIYKHTNDDPPRDEIDWVQLGNDGTCELYSKLNDGKQPSWANTPGGDDEEGIARHLLCCLENYHEDTFIETAVAAYYNTDNKSSKKDSDYYTPTYIDRPPSIEEDEASKPMPMH